VFMHVYSTDMNTFTFYLKSTKKTLLLFTFT